MHERQTRMVAICLFLRRRFESWLGIVAYGLGQATWTSYLCASVTNYVLCSQSLSQYHTRRLSFNFTPHI